MKKVAAYCRVSTDRQKEEQTIEVQRTFIREWQDKNDATIVEWYLDDGWSGDTLERPDLDRLRDDVSKGLWDAVVFIDRDRLARTLAYQEYVIRELREKDIEVIFMNNPLADSALERAIQQVYGIVAEIERITTAERMRKGKIHKAKSGKLVGHIAPYGYRYIPKSANSDGYFEINEPEAEVVRMIFKWVADKGYSMRRVIKELYALSIPPAKKRKDWWTKSSIERLLKREDYRGISYFNKSISVVPKNPQKVGGYKKIKKSSRRLKPTEEWIAIPVPAIIDEDLFNRARQRLGENIVYNNRNKKYDYLFSGKVMCACGSKRVGDGVGIHHYYRCAQRIYKYPLPNKCTYEGVNAEILDKMVWGKLLKLLAKPELLEPIVKRWLNKHNNTTNKYQDELIRLSSTLNKLGDERARYAKAYGAGALEFEQFKGLIKEAQAKEAMVKQQTKQLEEKSAVDSTIDLDDVGDISNDLYNTIKYAPATDRRVYVRKIIDSVIVGERRKALVKGYIPVNLQAQNIQYGFTDWNYWNAECGEVYSF